MRIKVDTLETISMVPCEKSQWPNIDQNTFDIHDIGSCYCPIDADREKVSIRGFFTSEIFNYVYFAIVKCNNATSPVTCAPSA